MSTQELIALKKEVKQQIDNADERVVRMVYALLEADVNEGWLNALPDSVKTNLAESLEQADRNEVISHEDVKKKHPGWFTR